LGKRSIQKRKEIMAVPKFVVKRIAKKVIKSVLKRENMAETKKVKRKEIKAQVEKEAKEQQELIKNIDVETNIADIDSMDIAEGNMSKKDKRKEVKKRVKAAKAAAKSQVTRTESPLARYKCSYNSKKSSLRKTEEKVSKKELKKRIVIEDRGRGLGGITQDTTTNKFYSQTYPNVEMDSTHTHNPFDRNLVTVKWGKK